MSVSGACLFHALQAPIGSVHERAFDLQNPSQEVILFELSRGGILELIAEDELGEVYAAPIWIELALVDPRDSSSAALEFQSGHRRLRSESGKFRAPPVAIGQRWSFSAEPVDGSRDRATIEIEGPGREGDVVEARLRLGAARPMLRARLLDAQGSPLREQEVGTQLVEAGRDFGHQRLMTDAEGHVGRSLPAASMRAGEIEIWFATPMKAPRWMVAQRLPTPLAPGPIDLGDIACEEVPLGIAGQVVDGKGAPLSQARIHLSLRSETANGMRVPWTQQVTDEAGRFALRVPTYGTRLGIDVSCPSYLSVDLEGLKRAAPESLDLRVVLRRSGAIAGRVLLDSPEMAPSVSIQLVPQGQPSSSGISRRPGKDGRFEITPVPPGLYELAFGGHAPRVEELRGERSYEMPRLFVLRDLRVPEDGGSCGDARLESIDLRGLLAQRRMLVLQPDGVALASTRVCVAVRSLDGALRSIVCETNAHGATAWSGERGATEATLTVKRFRSVRVDPNVEEQTVRLQDGWLVAIELEGAAPPLPEGCELRAWLRFERTPDLWLRSVESYPLHLGPLRDGRTEFRVPELTSYRAGWLIWDQRAREPASAEVEPRASDRIEVRDLDTVQAVTLVADPAAVQAALRTLGRR
ncbi:MAG: carboxypeptidase regulatory-like domain-containing protein [Planctomycetes bacterium]|nr:carboxypeptidase regulatory-like domain-containing protein [Planctomycetota bacterium]